MHLESLKFKKTGAEVKKATTLKVEALVKDRTALQNDISAICKRRGLNADEVFAMADDEEALSTYSSSYSGAAQGPVGDLRADLRAIRVKASEPAKLNLRANQLALVALHVEPERSFDLSFNELQSLGF